MTEAIKPDLDATIGFLEAFAPDGPINLCAMNASTGRVEGATFNDLGAARTWLAQRVDHANLYYTINPSLHPSGEAERVRKVDIPEGHHAHVDIDCDKAVDGLTLQQRKDTVLMDLELSEHPPTFVTDSGGGLQPIWKLDAPVTVEQVESINRWLIEKYGGDPGTWNADRLLRLPGTINFPSEKKRERGRVIAPTKLVRSTGELHSVETFGRIDAPAKAEADIVLGAPEEVDIETLGLPERLLTIVRDGEVPGEVKSGDNSASGWLFDGVINMLRHGVMPEQVLWIILDPGLGISTSVLKRPDADQLRYAEHQVRSALARIEGERRADVKEMGEVDEEWLDDADPPEKPAAKRASRFKRYSIHELLDLPDPVWTVEAILMERSLAMLYGSPKSFKTFLSLDLGLCIATGRPFHGHAVIRGTVTYVAAEGNPGETRNRVLAWCRANGVDPKSMEGWFKLVTTGAHLDNAAVVKEFIEEDPEPCDVTFIDTVNRSMAGDESSTKDMTAFVAGCDEVRRRLKTAVIAVHHSGVNSERERGSTVLRAAVDTRLRVTQKNGVVTLEIEDQRAGPSGERMHFRPVPTPVRGLDGPESIVMKPTNAPSGKGYQDEGAPEPKRSADDVMLLRISEEGPEQYADLVSEKVKGFSKANVYKVRDRLIEDKLLRRGDKPSLTKAGEERVKELLDEGE